MSATAAVTDLYVNNNATAKCTDQGTGLASAPFCTIQAAADVALPGQTVHIAAGQYKEPVKLTHSGTASAPITFVGGKDLHNQALTYTQLGSYEWPPTLPHDLTVTGAQHIVLNDLFFANAQQEAVLVDGSSDITLMRGGASAPAGHTAIRVTNGSSKVTVGRYGLGGLLVDQGSTDTVLTTSGVGSVLATDAPGTVIVGNTVQASCQDGITLAGASTGATVENNTVDTSDTSRGYPAKPCAADTNHTGVRVYQGSTTGTKVDYNVVSPLSGGPAYDWADQLYTAQAPFTAATGQGTHDFVAIPDVMNNDGTARLSPTIDSADENAPGMLDTDVDGQPAKDDPVVANTGTGKGFRDRGAREFANFGSIYTPAGPTRVLDTRSGLGGAQSPVQSGHSIDLQLADIPEVPESGVTAVTLNVTVTGPTAPGFLTVYPHGGQRPTASNLNWTAGTTIANLVTVPVVDGKVSFYAGGAAGSVDVIADLAGYYSSKGSVFTSAGPTRALDTRDGTGTSAAARLKQGGSALDLQLAGKNNLPPTGVTAVTLNVTAVNADGPGFLTVFPHGKDRPTASNLNWKAGQTIANLVTVPVVDGKVSFYAGGGAGSLDVIADIAGYYSADGYNTYWPDGPWRLMDTRQDMYLDQGSTVRKAGTVPGKGTLDIDVSSFPGPTSVTLNVTVTEPTAPGFLTAYPHGTDRPLASNLNWEAGQTIPNQVVVPVKDGKVSLYNGSTGPVHMVVDLFGFQKK